MRIGAIVVFSSLLTAFAVPAATASAATPHVDLSLTNPAITFNADGTWNTPSVERRADGKPQAVCRGQFLTPEVVAHKGGTAVHFGVKYFCTEPTDYTIVAKALQRIADNAVSERGKVTRSGVSQQPFIEGYSWRCKNNKNTGWNTHEYTVAAGTQHSGEGKEVTVGCHT